MKALEFYWLLQEQEGIDFINALSETDNMTVFSSTILKLYLDFIWSKTRPKIMAYRFFPFIVTFLVFSFFSTHGALMKINDPSNWGVEHTITGIVAFILSLYSLVFEGMKMSSLGGKYLNGWNTFFLISVLLNLITSLMDTLDHLEVISISNDVMKVMHSFTMLLMYFQVLYFMRILKTTAKLVRYVVEIMKEMRSFLLLMIVSILAIAHW